MEIDIEAGDTFAIDTHNSAVYQYRNHRCRPMGGAWLLMSRISSERDISRANFETIARIAGHTVKVVEPEPVVVTHGTEYVVHPGLIGFVGTKQACEERVRSLTGLKIVPIVFKGVGNG